MFLKIKAILILSRPFMSIIIAWSTIVGALLTKEAVSTKQLVIIGLTEFLIASGGFLHNAFNDWQQDRVNHPNNPIARKVVSITTVSNISGPCLVIGILMGAIVKYPETFIFTLSQSLILVFYPFIKKKSAISANIVASLLCASGFAYGALSVGKIGLVWFPFLITFIFVFGREIVKDIHDIAGDTIVGIQSIPILFGDKSAKTIVAITTLFCVPLFYIPIWIKNYTQPYLIAMPIVQILLVISVVLLADKYDTKKFLNLTAAIFVIVLLAFTFGL